MILHFLVWASLLIVRSKYLPWYVFLTHQSTGIGRRGSCRVAAVGASCDSLDTQGLVEQIAPRSPVPLLTGQLQSVLLAPFPGDLPT